MVSELAGEGAMPPQLPTPARRFLKIAKLRDCLRQQIRRGSLLLLKGVTKLKVFYYFNRSIRAVQSINQQRWRRFSSSIVSGSSWSRSAKSLSKVLIIRYFFAIYKRSRSVKFSSRVLVDVVVFAIFSRSSRSRSAESSSAELVLAISSPQRRTRNKKQSIPPIPDFASEKSQRRVSDLKNRVGELRSEIKAATANEAKQITESMKRKWFRGTVIEIDPPPPPPNFAVKKHLRSKLPRKIFDDYSSAYSELQSDILQESSDLDFSKYSPSVWSTYALEHSPFLEEHNSYDEISLVLEEEDGERYRMLRNRERRQVYGDLVVQKRLQMVHWTVQQSTKNELQKETMFLGVNLFDQFLTKGLFDQVEQSSQQKPNSSEFDGQQDGEISQNDQSVCSETSSLNCSVADQEAMVETIAIVTHEKAKENETLARLTSEVSSLKEMKRQRLQKLQDLDEVLSKVIELTEVEVKSQNELEEIYRNAHMDTSGSTELPKGVVITHGNFVAILVAVMTVIPNFGTNDVYVAAEIVMMAGDASIGYSLALTLTDAFNKIKKGTQGDASMLKPALMTGGLYFSNLQKVFKVIGNSVALNSSYGSAEEVACDSDSVFIRKWFKWTKMKFCFSPFHSKLDMQSLACSSLPGGVGG